MKFVYPAINEVFDTENMMYNSVVIENKKLFSDIITDLYNQKAGDSGKVVVSENYTPVSIPKKVEIIDKFIPFELNTKVILNSVASSFEKVAVNELNFDKTMRLTSEIEQYLMGIALEFPCNIMFTDISVSSLIKHSGMKIESDFDCISEKMCEYMELVTEFERKKLFVTINMRSFVGDDEMERFSETAIMHGYDIIAIESCAYKKLKNEKRLIVDEDLCEISC